MNANIAKIFGPFILCLCSAFNFWQYNHTYFGKHIFYLEPIIDFLYVYIFISILLCIAYLMMSCLDDKWKEPGTNDHDYDSILLYNSEHTQKNDVYA